MREHRAQPDIGELVAGHITMHDVAPVSDNDLRRSFLQESRDRIERMAQSALHIETGSDESLASVLADVHGLKGTSAVAGFADLSNACHNFETVINALRHDDSVFTSGAELNELLAQTVLDFCDYCTEYCNAISNGVAPPAPPAFLMGESSGPSITQVPPFRTEHGIAGGFDGESVSISIPGGTTAAEFQAAVSNFQKYILSTPRGIVWNVDISSLAFIDLQMAGELYLLQEMLRERHAVMNLVGLRASACDSLLLDRMKRRFRIDSIS
ncbi:MAG: Hpt domain-containing protein [Candidatus Hydrogenedentes bacterium]|nr:Hpt domain-containing protein [Candidatus Hydrogenedentota bacterium]